MKIPIALTWSLSLALASLTAPACSDASEAETGSESSAAALPDPAESGLMSPEEAAQEAEAAIDASNADSELERLKREIEAG